MQMKKVLHTLLFFIIATSTYAQFLFDNYTLTFESPSFFNHVIIPSYPGNKWQIGNPQKTLFTAAYSPSNVIVTDKLNSYPINDTSVFFIKNVTFGQGFVMPHTVILAGKYFVNSDTLTDFGKIEFSPDNGTTWINLITATTYSSSIFWFPKPTLTGNSFGWKDFYVNIAQLGPIFNIQDNDTVLYKFSFISDNIQTNKDGLMYDDLHFEDYIESLPEIQSDRLISIFPNPSKDQLTIKQFDKINPANEIRIYNSMGQLILTRKISSLEETINSGLEKGLYFYSLSNSTGQITNDKLIVE